MQPYQPVPTSPADWWKEQDERVLWTGAPHPTAWFRRIMFLRLCGLGVFAFLAVLLSSRSVSSSNLRDGAILAFILVVPGGLYMRFYLGRLAARTTYVVTSRRVLAVNGTEESNSSALWLPVEDTKVKLRQRHNNSGTVTFGKAAGRIGRPGSAASTFFQGLGLVDRPTKETLDFVAVEHPERVLSALRGARSAHGLPGDF